MVGPGGGVMRTATALDVAGPLTLSARTPATSTSVANAAPSAARRFTRPTLLGLRPGRFRPFLRPASVDDAVGS